MPLAGGLPGSHESDARKQPRRSGRFTGNLGVWGTESCNAHTGLLAKATFLVVFLQYIGQLICELRHCMASGIALDFAC